MNIVTLSRLVGAYGDIIATIVARRMALDLIGREELHEMAQSYDPEYRDACALYEKEHGPGFFERLFFDRPSFYSLFEALTYDLASRGNVVLVGRGAQIVLRDIPGVFRARIVAPTSIRITRIMGRYNFTREEAEAFVGKYDHTRDNLVRSIFHKDINDWSLYDIVVNTANFTASSASEIVIDAVDEIQKVPDELALREKLRNMALAKRVESSVRRKLSSSAVRNVEITADSAGLIRITGRVRSEQEKEAVEEIVSGHSEAVKVENELMVTGFSYGP
ncbi:MAG TPA: cytidylate kinase family protein [Desulfomonilaceae bacterium]|nr:cytidylate kinase family protein [Desulfomonilaceae bacterium]